MEGVRCRNSQLSVGLKRLALGFLDAQGHAFIPDDPIIKIPEPFNFKALLAGLLPRNH